MANKLVSSVVALHHHHSNISKKKKPMGVIMKRDTTKKKKRLLKKILQYLKCDLYMFAPLLSTHPTSHAQTHSLPTGVEANEEGMGEKENKKKVAVLVRVGEFMKSDYYMYAPLVTPQSQSHSISHPHHTGPMQQDAESVRERELTKKGSHDREEEGRKSDQESKGNNDPHHTGILRHRILQQRRTVKHIVHGKFCGPSVSGQV